MPKTFDNPDSAIKNLLATYGLGADFGRAQERFLGWAALLQRKLTAKTDPEALADHVMQVDARLELFMLEGLCRLYKKLGGIEEQLGAVKILEDQLGAVDYTRAMRDAGRRAALPDPALAVLDQQSQKAQQDLVSLLRANWLAAKDGRIPALARFLTVILETSFGDDQSDRAFLRKELSRRLKKVTKADYDFSDLEAGIHELRRQIRWFPIYFSALGGIVRLDDTHNPVADFEPMLRDPVADSSYATVPASDREPDPIPISKSLYLANTKFISELGELKDFGQTVEGLAHALYEAGVAGKRKAATKAALAALGKNKADLHQVHERSREIYQTIRDTKLLKHLRKQIRASA